MSHVSVTIHGRQYRMACEDGQEDHLIRLSKDLDQRIEQLKGSFGAIGDMRLIVMAALTLGDELSGASKRSSPHYRMRELHPANAHRRHRSPSRPHSTARRSASST
jgi:cell division protein ZapA (FtsZ GTPase activity inhibitor)